MSKELEEKLGHDVEFQPKPFYEPTTDSIIVYLKNESSYAKRVNEHITLFVSNSDDTIVGFEIEGVKDICRIPSDYAGDNWTDNID